MDVERPSPATANTPQLVLHVSDRTLTPIYSATTPTSSSNAQPLAQRRALSSLTANAITAYDCASRLGMGRPQRIMIETHTGGPIVLHSFLGAQSVQRSDENEQGIVEQTRDGLRALVNMAAIEPGHAPLLNGSLTADPLAEDLETDQTSAPSTLLIASVIAPSSADATEARRAASRLEKEFQREFAGRQQVGERVASGSISTDDG